MDLTLNRMQEASTNRLLLSAINRLWMISRSLVATTTTNSFRILGIRDGRISRNWKKRIRASSLTSSIKRARLEEPLSIGVDELYYLESFSHGRRQWSITNREANHHSGQLFHLRIYTQNSSHDYYQGSNHIHSLDHRSKNKCSSISHLSLGQISWSLGPDPWWAREPFATDLCYLQGTSYTCKTKGGGAQGPHYHQGVSSSLQYRAMIITKVSVCFLFCWKMGTSPGSNPSS